MKIQLVIGNDASSDLEISAAIYKCFRSCKVRDRYRLMGYLLDFRSRGLNLNYEIPQSHVFLFDSAIILLRGNN